MVGLRAVSFHFAPTNWIRYLSAPFTAGQVTVAVVGCGGIGLSAVNGAAIAGAGRIIAIDRDPGKLELAKKFGATHGVLADADTVKNVIEMTPEEEAGVRTTC